MRSFPIGSSGMSSLLRDFVSYISGLRRCQRHRRRNGEFIYRLQGDVNVTCRSSQDLIYQHKTAKDLLRNLLYVIHLAYLPGLTRRTQNP
jgi:hypothetical protein